MLKIQLLMLLKINNMKYLLIIISILLLACTEIDYQIKPIDRDVVTLNDTTKLDTIITIK